MRILVDHSSPFVFAHGGLRVQVEQTVQALKEIGVDVDFVRWWDPELRGDIIHFFATPSLAYVVHAKKAGWPIVVKPLLSETSNRPDWKISLQALLTRMLLSLPFAEGVKNQLTWRTFAQCSRVVVGLKAEKDALTRIFRVRDSAVAVVPLGVSKQFLQAEKGKRQDDHLISTGTITAVKGSVELARLAHAAKTPVLFVGKPFDCNDPYWLEFRRLVDDRVVKYRPHIDDPGEMIQLLRGARGFVLFSRFENWSLSASEAVACGLPLLLPRQKWALERFGTQVRYFPSGSWQSQVSALRRFYDDCPHLAPPGIHLHSWTEVAQQLKSVYSSIRVDAP
jgi:glycosyltransferase involved in cell wall biosynthesis